MANKRRFFDDDPKSIRDLINKKCMELEAPFYHVDVIKDVSIKGDDDRETSLRIYQPKKRIDDSFILFIHGGAWVAGNLETHDNLARALCVKTEKTVIAVDYLNSPEGKFPYPLEQCYDALLWASSEFGKTAKIAVVGDSAGANMAAALTMMARDRGGPTITFQALLNPAPDLTCKGTLQPQDDDLDFQRWQAQMYVDEHKDVALAYVSPLQANNFTDLPSALICLAEDDSLYADGKAYAEKLRSAEVKVNIYCQFGSGHLAGHGARATRKASETIEVAAVAIKHALK